MIFPGSLTIDWLLETSILIMETVISDELLSQSPKIKFPKGASIMTQEASLTVSLTATEYGFNSSKVFIKHYCISPRKN